MIAPDDPRHGTYNGYGNHRCRCDLCRKAANAYQYERQIRYRRARGVRSKAEYLTAVRRHPSVSRYNKGCRCDGCRALMRERQIRYRNTGTTKQ